MKCKKTKMILVFILLILSFCNALYPVMAKTSNIYFQAAGWVCSCLFAVVALIDIYVSEL